MPARQVGPFRESSTRAHTTVPAVASAGVAGAERDRDRLLRPHLLRANQLHADRPTGRPGGRAGRPRSVAAYSLIRKRGARRVPRSSACGRLSSPTSAAGRSLRRARRAGSRCRGRGSGSRGVELGSSLMRAISAAPRGLAANSRSSARPAAAPPRWSRARAAAPSRRTSARPRLRPRVPASAGISSGAAMRMSSASAIGHQSSRTVRRSQACQQSLL